MQFLFIIVSVSCHGCFFPHHNPFCAQALVNDKCEHSTINILYSNVSIIIQNKYSFDVTISGLICCVILIVILMTGQRLIVSLWISFSPRSISGPHTLRPCQVCAVYCPGFINLSKLMKIPPSLAGFNFTCQTMICGNFSFLPLPPSNSFDETV